VEPDLDIFTSEIEDTIDDLFTPKKKIEIDPLTQEVKVIGDGGETPAEPEAEAEAPSEPETTEIEIALTDEAIEISGPEKSEDEKGPEGSVKGSEAEGTATNADQEGLFELELEPEIAAQADSHADSQPVVESTEESPVQLLKQTIFTIEWEVKTEQIDDALNQIGRIEKEITGLPPSMIMELLPAMIMTLKKMRSAPDKVDPGAPALLKRSVELLEAAEAKKALDDGEISRLSDELMETLREKQAKEVEAGIPAEQGKKGEPEASNVLETQELEFELEPEVREHAQGTAQEAAFTPKKEQSPLEGPKAEETPKQQETQQQEAPVQAAEVESVSSVDFMIEQAGLSGEARALLEEHLEKVKGLINKILPVERVLKEQAGAEKLYLFQSSIRATLQEEYNRLSSYFLGYEEEFVPTATPSGRPEPKGQDHRGPEGGEFSQLPFKSLMGCTTDGLRLALLPEEVAMVVRPGLMNKGKIKGADTIKLKALKAWPWSKLSSLASGPLAEKSEKELAEIELPVVRKIGDNPIDTPSNFTVVVLFDGSKGCALLISDELQELDLEGKELKFRPEAKGWEKGQIETPDEIIHLITCKDSIGA
jgi:hypothetical protein